MDLKDKVVFVTGSSQGIGRETALEFAKEGANIIISYNSNKKKADEVFKECKKLSECLLVNLDVTDAESIKSCVEKAVDKFGAIDILINNAGVAVEKPFMMQTSDEIKRQLDTNLVGLMNITKAVLPYMIGQNEGIIINVASMAGKRVRWPDISVYCATKSGVLGFTRGIAKEYENSNIRFYAVNPTLTATQMTKFEGVNPKEVAETIINVAKENLGKKSGEDIDLD